MVIYSLSLLNQKYVGVFYLLTMKYTHCNICPLWPHISPPQEKICVYCPGKLIYRISEYFEFRCLGSFLTFVHMTLALLLLPARNLLVIVLRI